MEAGYRRSWHRLGDGLHAVICWLIEDALLLTIFISTVNLTGYVDVQTGSAIYPRSVIHSTIKSFLRSCLSYSEPSAISCLGRHLSLLASPGGCLRSKTSRQDSRSSAHSIFHVGLLATVLLWYLRSDGPTRRLDISSKPSTTKAWTTASRSISNAVLTGLNTIILLALVGHVTLPLLMPLFMSLSLFLSL